MFAFIREPVPPARIRNPVLPNPLNVSSSSEDDEDRDVEVVSVCLLSSLGVCENVSIEDDGVAGINAAEKGISSRNWSQIILFIVYRFIASL